jgi:hypothetical protein
MSNLPARLAAVETRTYGAPGTPAGPRVDLAAALAAFTTLTYGTPAPSEHVAALAVLTRWGQQHPELVAAGRAYIAAIPDAIAAQRYQAAPAVEKDRLQWTDTAPPAALDAVAALAMSICPLAAVTYHQGGADA